MLKKELLRIPVFGWGLALAKPIAIDRSQSKKALKQLLSQGKDRLGQGVSVVICPEGTRMRPGVSGKYNAGGSILAAQTNSPVVPIAHNSGSYWINKSILRKPGIIDVQIGKSLDARTHSASELNTLAKDWIEQTVQKLETGTSSTQ